MGRGTKRYECRSHSANDGYAEKEVCLIIGLKSITAQFHTNIEELTSDGINKGIFREVRKT